MVKKFINNFWSWQFLKYLVIGFTGTFFDFVILYLLVEYLHIFYLLAAILSVAIVLWYSFTLNKLWTFQNYEKKYFVQFIQYVISHSVALGVNLGVLTALVEIFGLWYLFAKVFATAAAAITNFLIVKKYIFQKESKPASKLAI